MFNIWGSLLLIINTCVSVLISVFPASDSAFVSEIVGFKLEFLGYISSLNWFFPIDTFLYMIGVVFAVEMIVLNTKVLHWLLKTISFGFIK